jgi:hypothetical protein
LAYSVGTAATDQMLDLVSNHMQNYHCLQAKVLG